LLNSPSKGPINTTHKEGCVLVSRANVPILVGNEDKLIELMCFDYETKQNEVLVLVYKSKDYKESTVPVIRVHSACITGEIFFSQKCDCGYQFSKGMEIICSSNYGIMLYMANHEGRGIGIANKISAYQLQERGFNTLEANEKLGFKHDERDFGSAPAILKFLNVNKVKIITNNPEKVKYLSEGGIEIDEVINIVPPVNVYNEEYLKVKRDILNHALVLEKSRSQEKPELSKNLSRDDDELKSLLEKKILMIRNKNPSMGKEEVTKMIKSEIEKIFTDLSGF